MIRIGDHLVNLLTVKYEILKDYRLFWPPKEYQLLKKRKAARINRERRKREHLNSKG